MLRCNSTNCLESRTSQQDHTHTRAGLACGSRHTWQSGCHVHWGPSPASTDAVIRRCIHRPVKRKSNLDQWVISMKAVHCGLIIAVVMIPAASKTHTIAMWHQIDIQHTARGIHFAAAVHQQKSDTVQRASQPWQSSPQAGPAPVLGSP